MAISTEIPTIKRHEIRTEETLGEGSYGVVYHARWAKVEVALKELSTRLREEELSHFKQEALIMMNSQHPRIVRLFGITHDAESKFPGLVMEYMPNGSLDSLLLSKRVLPWPKRIKIARQMTEGLAFLHDRNIIHRDLKSLNILLDEKLNAKLGDFGHSKVAGTQRDNTYGNQAGTLAWRAPELLIDQNNTHNFKTDIYSLGITFWELASRRRPYCIKNAKTREIKLLDVGEIWNAAKMGNRKAIGPIPEDCPILFKELIERCWSQSPDLRPTAEETLVALEALESSFPNPPWQLDRSTEIPNDFEGRKFTLVEPTSKDLDKVTKLFQQHAPTGYKIGRIQAIVSPMYQAAFKAHMLKLSNRQDSDFFKQTWETLEEDQLEKNLRRRLHAQFLKLSRPYQDQRFPGVAILPLWHGTTNDPSKILSTGLVAACQTDRGFFGEGVYFTHHIDYATLYSNPDKPTVLLCYVATQSVFPTIAKDQDALYGQDNLGKYDGRFMWVKKRPTDEADEINYDACGPNDKPEFIELMVKQQAAIFPAFVVELEKTGEVAPKALPCPCNEVKYVLSVEEKRADDAFIFEDYKTAKIIYQKLFDKETDPVQKTRLAEKLKRARPERLEGRRPYN